MGKKKKSSPSPAMKKSKTKHKPFQTKGNKTTDFQIDVNLELVSDDFENEKSIIQSEKTIMENAITIPKTELDSKDDNDNSESSIQEEQPTTNGNKQKIQPATKDGRLITKEEEELENQKLTEESQLAADEETTNDSSPSKEEALTDEEQQALEKEQRRLEKEYSKMGLKERIWLTISPLAVLGLIGYYTHVGFLAFQDSTFSNEETTPSVEIEETTEESPSVEQSTIEQTDEITTETPIVDQQEEVQESKTYLGFSNYKSLNVRAEPSEKATIVGSLTLNEEVEILELATESLNWHKINYNGQEAYVREDFIFVVENE